MPTSDLISWPSALAIPAALAVAILLRTSFLAYRNKRRHGDFPSNFTVQRIEILAATQLSDLPAADIARAFRNQPEIAKRVLAASYDKRYTPSTYIKETDSGFEVGWFTRRGEHQCVKEFSKLEDAATDYLLFSLGKRRWDSTLQSS